MVMETGKSKIGRPETQEELMPQFKLQGHLLAEPPLPEKGQSFFHSVFQLTGQGPPTL